MTTELREKLIKGQYNSSAMIDSYYDVRYAYCHLYICEKS
jgi:hypothetical protein